MIIKAIKGREVSRSTCRKGEWESMERRGKEKNKKRGGEGGNEEKERKVEGTRKSVETGRDQGKKG